MYSVMGTHSKARLMTRYPYYAATSLDGFLADEDHSLDWLFEHSDAGLSRGHPRFRAAAFPRPFNLRLREHGRAGPFLAAIYDVLGARGKSA